VLVFGVAGREDRPHGFQRGAHWLIARPSAKRG
jgi:hypothetical protein